LQQVRIKNSAVPVDEDANFVEFIDAKIPLEEIIVLKPAKSERS